MDNLTPIPKYPDVISDKASSAVSWSAIVAGAVVAASTSLLLIALGTGIGLASISPWSHTGVSPTTFAVGSAMGLIVVQWLSAGVGGYIAGRLRTRWIGVHTHEVFFRDTAHGFITWATATVLVTVVSASVAVATVGGGVRAAASVGSGATARMASAESPGGSVDPYDVDTLLRPANPDGSAGNEVRAQATRILARGLVADDVPPADRAYLVQAVSTQAGLSPTDAQTRVDTVIAKIKAAKAQALQAAAAAIKAARSASIFTALAMLIGAFIASIAAALGGKLRDLHP
jgi:hypothetical protein